MSRTADPGIPPEGAPASVAGCARQARQLAGLKRQAVLASAGCLAALGLCATLRASNGAAAVELRERRTRAAKLAADAASIAQLRGRPQQATETGLQSADLLDRVASAMRAAHLVPQTLVSTMPQPPRRLPNSPHAEIVHRLMFETIPLEGLSRFCHALMQAAPELQVTGLYLRPANAGGNWNVDVSLAYWIIAPRAER
jgi:hypothetical protein